MDLKFFKSGFGLLLLIILLVIVFFLIWLALAFNGLVAQEETAKAQCEEVENQYLRKFDLLPALEDVVITLLENETNALIRIAELRSQWADATAAERANITQELDLLLTATTIQEAYPNIHSILLGQDLMDELATTENQISVARMRYIEDARDYNIKIRQFPDSIAAGMFGFDRLTTDRSLVSCGV
jgi:LemA protein